MNIVFSLLIGIAAGTLSGLVGIGGGVLIIPALVFLFGLTQHQAQGTTLAAMIPPIGILAAWVYYKNGNVNIPIALFVALGFIAGGYFGATIANDIPHEILKKIFGVTLLLISLHIIFSK